ncbi:unnamed protein product [Durusdinium trenchii]|uniref:Altered inheritance of mitochondria protein 21 n=3 Tax=Durusdinium trenchii TaxID=1381693 RepID=A0ABP0LHR5_9DINO
MNPSRNKDIGKTLDETPEEEAMEIDPPVEPTAPEHETEGDEDDIMESVKKAPAHNKASTPAKTKLAPNETAIPLAEFGGSSSGSHSRHTESEESLVDDPMERDDIEEVVEPADPDLELKDSVRDGHHKEVAEIAKANREPKATPFSSAESMEKAPAHNKAPKPAKLAPKETPIPLAEFGGSLPGSRCRHTESEESVVDYPMENDDVEEVVEPADPIQEFGGSLPGSRSRHTELEESVADDPMENDDIEVVVEPADPNLEPKDPVRDGHHKEAAEVARANREPQATPFPPDESAEKAPDHKKASKPAKTKLTPKEFGGILPGSPSRHTESEESLVDDPMKSDDIEEVVEPADPNLEPKEAAEVAKANREPKATPFSSAESVEKGKAPAHKKASTPAKTKLAPKEFGGSSRNSHSRRTESKDIVVDDPMQSDDVEEVVELAQTNPKPEDPPVDESEVARANREPKATPFPPAESVEKALDHKKASTPAKTKLEPKEFARRLPGTRSRHTESEESLVDDPMEHDDIEEVVEPADPNPEPKDPVGRDGHHKEAAQVAKANREPKATPFSPAEADDLPDDMYPEVLMPRTHRIDLENASESSSTKDDPVPADACKEVAQTIKKVKKTSIPEVPSRYMQLERRASRIDQGHQEREDSEEASPQHEQIHEESECSKEESDDESDMDAMQTGTESLDQQKGRCEGEPTEIPRASVSVRTQIQKPKVSRKEDGNRKVRTGASAASSTSSEQRDEVKRPRRSRERSGDRGDQRRCSEGRDGLGLEISRIKPQAKQLELLWILSPGIAGSCIISVTIN